MTKPEWRRKRRFVIRVSSFEVRHSSFERPLSPTGTADEDHPGPLVLLPEVLLRAVAQHDADAVRLPARHGGRHRLAGDEERRAVSRLPGADDQGAETAHQSARRRRERETLRWRELLFAVSHSRRRADSHSRRDAKTSSPMPAFTPASP